ncbi:MAG: EcsC family protein [Geobacter sp.]|nr:EcsC family protein [Geobacter sp.]
MNENMIMQVLDYGYDKAVNGLPGMETAEELAASYMKPEGILLDQAATLVNWQISKAATSGFLSGLGGLITLPVAVPANIASVLYVQIRMIAAIASMGGYDIRSDQVRTLVYMCLCGSAITDILKDIGIQVGTKLTKSAINKISSVTITKINQTVGFRLVTKFGQTGAINLGKAVPFLGGVIGGTVDAVATRTIGKVAINTFIEKTEPPPLAQ